MSKREGLIRIASVIRWIGNGLGSIFAIYGIGALVVAFGRGEAWLYLAIGLVLGALFWGCGRGLAWIIEGFAQD